MVLSLAGLDPGGGAGLIADVKAIEAHGCWAAAVATALTSQTVAEVRAIRAVPAALLSDQVDAVFHDLDVAAVKVGMLCGRETVEAVENALRGRDVPVVLDPVIASSSGTVFLDADGVAGLRERLLPRVDVLTPNLEEAGLLVNLAGANASDAAHALLDLGVSNVLVSGGAGRDGRCVDRLFAPGGQRVEIVHRAFATNRVHGTGCVHSASVASRLALGDAVVDAARAAASWMERAVERGVPFGAGGAPDAAWSAR